MTARFQVIGEYGEFYGEAATLWEAEQIRDAHGDPRTRIFDDYLPTIANYGRHEGAPHADHD